MSEEQPPPGPAAPPSGADPWAVKYGLVRPRHGRYIAGVCGALARSTATDPLLWRVLLGVTALFGLGLVVYLIVWLLTPAEGDTASPVEALFGRGHSSTSTVFTIVLSVLAIVVTGAVTDNTPLAILAVISLVIVALVVSRNNRPAPVVTVTEPVTVAPPAYQAPFAPHGPYATQPERIPPAPRPPKPEQSRLGRLIFGLMVLSLGVLGLVDLSGYDVASGLYAAVPLLVIGLGLVVGAWLGRARGYIVLGLALCLVLPMVGVGREIEGGSQTWHPSNLSELQPSYQHRLGQALLDLRDIPFTDDTTQQIDVEVNFGEFVVIVPANVDVVSTAEVRFGQATMFGDANDGPSGSWTVNDLGQDAKTGGGKLRLNLKVNFGSAEVVR